MTIDNFVIIICIVILVLYHVIENKQRGGQPAITQEKDYIDKQCNYLIKRGETYTTNPECLMFQPMLRPCGLNSVFFQNCKGDFLVAVEPEKKLEWKAFKSIKNPKTACFLIDAPINPVYLDIPGYCSIKSFAFPGYFWKMDKGTVILAKDPRYTNECKLCDYPLFKECCFKIKRGFAMFDKAYSVLDFMGNYCTAKDGVLQRSKQTLTTTDEKVNSTFYFGPNTNVLPL